VAPAASTEPRRQTFNADVTPIQDVRLEMTALPSSSGELPQRMASTVRINPDYPERMASTVRMNPEFPERMVSNVRINREATRGSLMPGRETEISRQFKDIQSARSTKHQVGVR
jgi:hypothetical protein